MSDNEKYIDIEVTPTQKAIYNAWLYSQQAMYESGMSELIMGLPGVLEFYSRGVPTQPTPQELAIQRIINRDERVTRNRVEKEVEDMRIEKMMPHYDAAYIAADRGMPVDTVKSRIKKIKARNSP